MMALVVCGSPPSLPDHLQANSYSGCYKIGVDRGALKLIEKGIELDVAIGDFDSVTNKELQTIRDTVKKVVELPTEKDVTDCEAAIEHAVKKGCRVIHLYGVTGARFDHQFATIVLLLKYAKQDVKIIIIDNQNRMEILTAGEHVFSVDKAKRYISFFSFEETVKNLEVDHVKYPLKGYDLSADDSLCVSNEPLKNLINISFDSGYLLVVQSSD